MAQKGRRGSQGACGCCGLRTALGIFAAFWLCGLLWYVASLPEEQRLSPDIPVGSAISALSAERRTPALAAASSPQVETKLPAQPRYPDLEGLMRRLGEALATHQQGYRAKHASRNACERGFEEHSGADLSGCPRAGCLERSTLDDAKQTCKQLADCGGIVRQAQVFQLRASGVAAPAAPGNTAWVRKSCHVPEAVEKPWHGKVCDMTYGGPHPSTYLAGCPETVQCAQRPSREEAQALCDSLPDCGGITTGTGLTGFEVRAGPELQRSPDAREISYKRPRACNPAKRAPSTAEQVWQTFVNTMNASLDDPSLNLQADLGQPRDDDSVFISISSYRDVSCEATVRSAFKHAEQPSRVNVGIVQQNCLSGCMMAEGWADTRRLKPGPPDPDCVEKFCASDLGREHCSAGRVRILRLEEPESLGPLFSRYLNAKLWRGETYFLQIDAHTEFRIGWDSQLVEMIKRTPSFPSAVISNYPPAGDPRTEQDWPKSESRGRSDGLCGCTFEKTSDGEDSWTIRLSRPATSVKKGEGEPRYGGFMAAGFFFAHSSFLGVAPPDPFLPYLFMGEEMAITMRLWTSGFDVYAPEADVLGHEYVRKHGTKFWETVDMIYSRSGMHRDLTGIVVKRVQFLLGFPNARSATQVPGPTLTRMADYSAGKVRSLDSFIEVHGLDLAKRTQKAPKWCLTGEASKEAMEHRKRSAGLMLA